MAEVTEPRRERPRKTPEQVRCRFQLGFTVVMTLCLGGALATGYWLRGPVCPVSMPEQENVIPAPVENEPEKEWYE